MKNQKSTVPTNPELDRFPALINGDTARVTACGQGLTVDKDGDTFPMITVTVQKTGIQGAKPITLQLSAAMLLKAAGVDYANRMWGSFSGQAAEFGDQAMEHGSEIAGRIKDGAVAWGTPIAEDFGKQARDAGAKLAGKASEAIGDVKEFLTGKAGEDKPKEKKDEAA